jgi:hypothetical protein
VAGFVYIQRHWSRECDVIKGAELAKWHHLVLMIIRKGCKRKRYYSFWALSWFAESEESLENFIHDLRSLRIYLNPEPRKNQKVWNVTFLNWPHY